MPLVKNQVFSLPKIATKVSPFHGGLLSFIRIQVFWEGTS
jgi:hypothetical protein